MAAHDFRFTLDNINVKSIPNAKVLIPLYLSVWWYMIKQWDLFNTSRWIVLLYYVPRCWINTESFWVSTGLESGTSGTKSNGQATTLTSAMEFYSKTQKCCYFYQILSVDVFLHFKCILCCYGVTNQILKNKKSNE